APCVRSATAPPRRPREAYDAGGRAGRGEGRGPGPRAAVAGWTGRRSERAPSLVGPDFTGDDAVGDDVTGHGATRNLTGDIGNLTGDMESPRVRADRRHTGLHRRAPLGEPTAQPIRRVGQPRPLARPVRD